MRADFGVSVEGGPGTSPGVVCRAGFVFRGRLFFLESHWCSVTAHLQKMFADSLRWPVQMGLLQCLAQSYHDGHGRERCLHPCHHQREQGDRCQHGMSRSRVTQCDGPPSVPGGDGSPAIPGCSFSQNQNLPRPVSSRPAPSLCYASNRQFRKQRKQAVAVAHVRVASCLPPPHHPSHLLSECRDRFCPESNRSSGFTGTPSAQTP